MNPQQKCYFKIPIDMSIYEDENIIMQTYFTYKKNSYCSALKKEKIAKKYMLHDCLKIKIKFLFFLLQNFEAISVLVNRPVLQLLPLFF